MPPQIYYLKYISAVTVYGNVLVKEETKVEKIVTAMKKGSAVLDKCLPDHIKAQYHVLQVVSQNVFFSKGRKVENYYMFIIIWF